MLLDPMADYVQYSILHLLVAHIAPWEGARHVGNMRSPTLFFNPSIPNVRNTQCHGWEATSVLYFPLLVKRIRFNTHAWC